MESGTPAQEIETSSGDHTFQKGDWCTLIQSVRFAHNGRYVSGYVNSGQELMQLLESYRNITGTGFTNAQSLALAMKPVEHSVYQTRFMSPASKPRLFWQMNAGEPCIPFDGVPFMSFGQGTDLPCVRYGGKRKKIENVALPSGDVIPIDYRTKTGCEAKITIRRILRYTCAEYTDNVQGIAAIRRMRKQILDDLVQKIITGVAKPSERYYFLLPTPAAHSGHAVAEIENAPPIAQPVTEEIITQLSHGLTDIAQLREHVKNYVDITYGADPSLQTTDSSYYPSEADVFRLVYWLYSSAQVIDQESAFKATIGGLSNLDKKLATSTSIATTSQTVHIMTHPSPPMTSSADAITSVYSIIMDDDSTSDGATALEQLSENQIPADGEVELNAMEDGSQHDSEHIATSPIANQVQIHSSPITIPSSGHLSSPYTIASRKAVVSAHSSVASLHPGQPSRSFKSPSFLPPSEPEPSGAVVQAQTEVRDMLRIIENQTHACKNPAALSTLRRQLTELCSQFSMYLAGVPSTSFGTPPPAKKMKT